MLLQLIVEWMRDDAIRIGIARIPRIFIVGAVRQHIWLSTAAKKQ